MSLVLLHPTALPSGPADPDRTARPGPGHRAMIRHLAQIRHLDQPGAAAQVLDRLRRLPAAPEGMTFGAADPGGAAYDRFFGVSRTSTGQGVFQHSVLVAYRSLLEEGFSYGTRLSWAEWSSLCTALQTMLADPIGDGAGSLPIPEPRLLRWHLDPDRRWRVGHHVFFVLTQSLIVALNGLSSACDMGRPEEGRSALRLAARLLDASAAAFVFTAEFSSTQYQHRVRPSMEPPSVPAGFSGLLSPDHQHLVRMFARLRPVLRELPAGLSEEHRSLTRALETTYESHKYVCGRFGGDRSASLRMSDTTDVCAVEVIDRLKLARTRAVRT
ncbi:hypothetical protein [Pseudonocardia sp. TRM90224]|uniref:hypothetical protein n=1 Tax=Pseudonocardia sp. TRM90224 TaxID=2812678 RepID=UPI001E554354|nr:hypothetical protein [Pseudonocardia sp. TRM90224]